MATNEEQFDVRCDFCGNINQLTKDELYEQNNTGNLIFKEKYCLYCGEILIMSCPTCHRAFRLDASFSQNPQVSLLPSFWDPVPSPLDNLNPQLENAIKEYNERVRILTPDFLRASQKEFLEKVPNVKEYLTLITSILEKIKEYPEFRELLEGKHKEAQKIIKRYEEEIMDIMNNIEANSKLLSEKKESKLKKHVPLLDDFDKINRLFEDLKNIRRIQIDNEINSLKPGAEKVFKYFKQDVNFYRAKCPICSAELIVINKQLYIYDKASKSLKFLFALEQGPQSSEDNSNKIVKLNFTIHLDMKGQQEELHGKLNFSFSEGDIETVGRTLIREADFEDELAKDILYDEDDPLQYISKSQFTLNKKDGKLWLKGMEYDPDRPGTYLNSFDTDIRKMYPEGIALKSGDNIIVPLNTEIDNPNKITFQIEL
jgi:hypothetical protein